MFSELTDTKNERYTFLKINTPENKIFHQSVRKISFPMPFRVQ